ncbi:MAG: tyrosine-type recombinase/integrase [Thermomicrobiales bacterium]
MAGSIQKTTGPQGVAYLARVEYPRDAVTGKRRQRSASFKTKKAAEVRLAEWLVEIERGTAVDGSKMTTGEYLMHWLESYAQHNTRPSTFASYESYARSHLIPAIGGVMLTRLTATHLQELYSAKLRGGRMDGKTGGLSPRTVKYLHSIMREALQHAYEQSLVYRNVADAVRPPKGARPQVQVWNATEARTFLTASHNAPYAPLWLVLLTTGMRRGEALGLRWQDVDMTKGLIRVHQTLVDVNGTVSIGEPKTKSGRRTIELDSSCLAALKAHRERQAFLRRAWTDERRGHDLVFTTADGKWLHPRNVDREYFALLARIEKQRQADRPDDAALPRITLHGLRHTCATLLLLHNVNPKVVSERLGHASISITLDTYSHVLPSMQRDAADAIGAALFGVA